MAIPVTQAAFNPCDVERNGNINAADVQLILNQALGKAQPVNSLHQAGVVNVVDAQIEINAALGSVCLGQ